MTSFSTVPAIVDDETVHVVVESPRGSTVKFKYDRDHDMMTLSRPLPDGLVYPYDWGFVPSTDAPDGDPLDAIIMWDRPGYPGVVIPCRPIGVLRVDQKNAISHERERNDRVLVLPIKAPRFDSIRSVFDCSERSRLELQQFLLASVAFEGKDVQILGWAGPADAMALVRGSVKKESGVI